MGMGARARAASEEHRTQVQSRDASLAMTVESSTTRAELQVSDIHSLSVNASQQDEATSLQSEDGVLRTRRAQVVDC